MGLTTKQVATELKCSVPFVLSLIYRGKLKAEKFGPIWSIDPESVKKYKNSPKDPGGRPKQNPKT